MIHYIKDSTLIMEGEFEAISSGINGGRACVECLFNHQVQPGFNHFEPAQYMGRLADSLQLQRPYFGLLTAVNMDDLCVSTDDYLTTFVTAGITHPSGFRVRANITGNGSENLNVGQAPSILFLLLTGPCPKVQWQGRSSQPLRLKGLR